ncbi:MAG: NAD-dependent epimerase/dehydratase family protein [Actinomycetes bacterium]
MADVVLVTGVSRYLGGRFASMLSRTSGVSRVIGVDVVPPPHDIGSAEFVRADIRNPVIAKVIGRAEVDTVVHMNVIATPTSAGGRASMKEINVIGTMQLLAACQKAPTVRRLVVKSTAAVYGSSPRDPALFTEDMGPKVMPRAGWGKDSVEVEGYVRGFSRRRPDVDVAVLRLANFVGPGVRTAVTDYLELPVVPTVLGYDPRFQLVHEDDGLEAMLLATTGQVTGFLNVAADGFLTLRQAARIAGRPTLPVPGPLVSVVGSAIRTTGLADFSSDQVRFLSFGRGLDTTRMRADLGLEPRWTTREALEDLVRARRLHGLLSPSLVRAGEQAVLAAAGPVLREVESFARGVRPGG